MAHIIKAAALAALLAPIFSVAQDPPSIPTCGPNKKCPSDTPCCSLYGQCGVGAYCLGGCDPLYSHTFESCVPMPACKSGDFKLTSLDDVSSIDTYLGDASQTNWQSQGKPVVYEDSILLTMAQDTVGTLLASTHYVWYGKISAKLTTSQGAGVVTAFIMMSDVKDEIDFEFIGTDIGTAQSNFYCQGVLDYTNSENLTASNTVETMHEYTIDWKPESITWSIDGTEMRTVQREDTWNATANRFDFPQTPSRIMLSLWPAGLPSNGKGTVEWAGGMVDWNSPYMQNGYYYANVAEVNVECYDPPSSAQSEGSKSYVITGATGTNDTVKIIDDVKVLKSIFATGEKADFDPNAQPDEPKPSQRPETVPGMSGGGNRGDDDVSSVSNGQPTPVGGGGGGGGDSDGPTPTNDATPAPTDETSFDQNNNNGAQGAAQGAVGGSVLAVVMAVFGLVFF